MSSIRISIEPDAPAKIARELVVSMTQFLTMYGPIPLKTNKSKLEAEEIVFPLQSRIWLLPEKNTVPPQGVSVSKRYIPDSSYVTDELQSISSSCKFDATASRVEMPLQNGVSEGVIEGTTDMEGTSDGVMETSDGAIEGTIEGITEGTKDGTELVEGAADGLIVKAEVVCVMDVTAAHSSTPVSFVLFAFFFLDLIPVDKTPLPPTVKTNCGQRQMFTSILVPLMETVSPGAMMMPSCISSLVTASGHVKSDIPTFPSSTLALNELKCWMIVAS
jgi:hypothetical protein